MWRMYGDYGYYPIEPAYGVWTSYVTDKNGNPARDIGYYGFFGSYFYLLRFHDIAFHDIML